MGLLQGLEAALRNREQVSQDERLAKLEAELNKYGLTWTGDDKVDCDEKLPNRYIKEATRTLEEYGPSGERGGGRERESMYFVIDDLQPRTASLICNLRCACRGGTPHRYGPPGIVCLTIAH